MVPESQRFNLLPGSGIRSLLVNGIWALGHHMMSRDTNIKAFDNIYIEVFKPVASIFGLEKCTGSGKVGKYQAIPP